MVPKLTPKGLSLVFGPIHICTKTSKTWAKDLKTCIKYLKNCPKIDIMFIKIILKIFNYKIILLQSKNKLFPFQRIISIQLSLEARHFYIVKSQQILNSKKSFLLKK